MLANKRTTKSASPKPSTLTPLNQSTRSPTPPPLSAASLCNIQTQTATWSSITAEVLGPERQRVTALQAELKTIKALLKDKETSAEDELKEKQRQQAERIAELEAQVSSLQSELHLSSNDLIQQRDAAQAECKLLTAKLSRADELGHRNREDLDLLRADLVHSQDTAKSLQKQLTNLTLENEKVSAERDRLLKELEEQQAEMIARVEAVEQRFQEKSDHEAEKRRTAGYS